MPVNSTMSALSTSLLAAVPSRRRRLSPAVVASSPEELVGDASLADFVRFRPGELQTAVVRYEKNPPWAHTHPPLHVDLVSMLHFADKKYFDTLQQRLEHYDCVLYEMVASREILQNLRNIALSEIDDDLGFIRRKMLHTLSLEYQLDCLDYGSEKWRHADLDIETYEQLERERRGSFLEFARDMPLKLTKAFQELPASIPDGLGFWRSQLLWAEKVLPMPLAAALIISRVCSPSDNNKAEEYPELEALSMLDFGAAVKIFLARQLITSEFAEMNISTEVEENALVISERNGVAMEELKRAIDSGHRRIAVIYGAGHMPDLGRRLQEEFNMVPSEVQWVTAWSIRIRELDSNSRQSLETMVTPVIFAVLALDLWLWKLVVGAAVDWASWAASQVDQFSVPF